MKKLILLAVIVVLAGGIYWFMSSFNSIVKKLVHQYGSQVTQTSVDISGIKLNLSSGEAAVKSITVANPKGYQSPYLFELAEISVAVDLKSLTTDTIIIKDVEVKKPVITYEMLSLTKNNINDVLNNVKSYTAGSAQEAKPEPAADKKASGPSKKIIIKKLVIDQGELSAVANLGAGDLKVPLKNNKATVTLPKIVMTDIGQSKGGEDIAGTIGNIITKVLTTASQTAMTANFGDLQDVVKGSLNGATDAVNNVKDTAGNAANALKDTVNIFKK